MVFQHLKQWRISHQWREKCKTIMESTSQEAIPSQSVEVSTIQTTIHIALLTTIFIWGPLTCTKSHLITQLKRETVTHINNSSVSMKTCSLRYKAISVRVIKNHRNNQTYSNQRRVLRIHQTATVERKSRHWSHIVRVCKNNTACQHRSMVTTPGRQRCTSLPT